MLEGRHKSEHIPCRAHHNIRKRSDPSSWVPSSTHLSLDQRGSIARSFTMKSMWLVEVGCLDGTGEKKERPPSSSIVVYTAFHDWKGRRNSITSQHQTTLLPRRPVYESKLKRLYLDSCRANQQPSKEASPSRYLCLFYHPWLLILRIVFSSLLNPSMNIFLHLRILKFFFLWPFRTCFSWLRMSCFTLF